LTQPSLVAEDPDVVTALTGVSYSSYSLNANSSASLSVAPDITGLVAGDTVTLGVQMNNTNWSAPVISNTSINVVENRLLTGTKTINAGRHMLGQIPGGTLTLNGGSLSGTEGTDISVNSGGFAQYANGIRLTSATDGTFDGAGQTHDLQVGYHGPAGAYSETVTLADANANQYTDASGVEKNEFGGYWSTETDYGSVLGGTETRVTGQQLTASQALGGSSVSVPTGSTSSIERNSNLVGTAQPVIASNVNSGLWDVDRAAGRLVNEKVNSLISGEAIQGGQLDLSEVSVTVNGTALYDRQITQVGSTGTIQTNLGRQMVSATTEVVSQVGTVTYGSTGLDDLTRTRLQLSNFSANDTTVDGFITAEYTGGDKSFDGDGQEAVVDVTAIFDIDRSAQGTHYKTVSSGAGSITSLEDDGLGGTVLAGQSVQSGVGLTYSWSNVDNNTISIEDQHVYVYDDTNLSDRNLSAATSNAPDGDGTHRVGSTNSYTAIGVDASIDLDGTRTAGTTSAGTITVDAGSGRVTEEAGLSGQQDLSAANDSFDVTVHSIGRADADISGGIKTPLNPNDVVTIQNKDRSLAGEQASLLIKEKGYTGSDLWTIDYVGNTLLAAGQQATMTANFNEAGVQATGFGGSYKSIFQFSYEDSFDQNSHLSGLGLSGDQIASGGSLYDLGNARNHTLQLERVIEQEATTATGSFGVGSSMADTSPSLTNTAANTSSGIAVHTYAEILDSDELTESSDVTMTYTKSEDQGDGDGVDDVFAGADGKFAADILGLEGLDEVKHVLSITYDETAIGSASEQELRLVWLIAEGDDAGTWVNAVLGNSDIDALDIVGGTVTVGGVAQSVETYLGERRFAGSYVEYLNFEGSVDPELGAWGVDVQDNTVWAVVDHNSSFSGGTGGLFTAVPEPSSTALLGLGGIALLLRRRR